ncbi:CRISPR-associated helicase, Cas3 family [Peptoclostridium litorale DSM 5388]|uniref:Metal dependent phosphohydrolase n=1 Tax=Peptoclostridium litorale DSM 5388 TaxID=1121324 RepID=A0A069RIX7_PEPLI|nr:CRISPR-associated helicase/endonuclease Cas3 [Peptoclostridium litorale]KDR96753.1 metal dependent phosphohydrolase [Peptoclostridium litorale DSM 5388]SIO34806.1 CRISPR-associated helicase, Cas3 family [Peptoclostridium litorale DSM 5388]
MKYFAHSSDGKQWQTMLEHLEQTAKIASRNALKFNARDFGYICGLLHDVGKYSLEFQEKLKGKSVKVDHSTAGAQEVLRLYGDALGILLAYCIAGHHSGLPDYGSQASTEGTLCSRKTKDMPDYSAYKEEINLDDMEKNLAVPVKPLGNFMGFTLSFFIRMLYSCLVDADFIDTEQYMSDEANQRGNNLNIENLNGRLKRFMGNFKCDESKINKKREEILKCCMEFSLSPPGLYSLTVPTGGGKTYSSLAFGLNHADVNGLERIIYVIPYTSIIEQNAKVFKNVLGEENVLEHHCNYQFENSDNEYIQSLNEKLRLASENWDIPIVVTTNVQFFESIFSNRSSKSRKIHNMSKSVIIFDEAQMLPLEYLKPCLLAICELVKNYGSTAILCTATQPAVNDIFPEFATPKEIMEDPRQLYQDFKKVRVLSKGEIEDEELANEMNELEQVLCIVNTRKHAKKICKLLKGKVFHLSTLMCPEHRKETLDEIRRRLEGGQQCRVVSTQLIEAGVDVDFPVVYRAMAGIDSIVQSAGRCNREGRMKEGMVFVFNPASQEAKSKGYLARTAKVAEMVFRKYEDPISLEAIDFYFKLLYDIEGEETFDKKGIIDCFEERGRHLEFDFKTAAQKFKLIENDMRSVVIPYDARANEILEEAKYSPYPMSSARKLQPYTVSIYEHEYRMLVKNTALKTVNDRFTVLDDLKNGYDDNTGLIIPEDMSGEGIFI